MAWLETLANAIAEMSGNGFDPHGCQLPAYKPKQEPRAALPKKEPKIKDVVDEDLLTFEELAQPNWRYTMYGMSKEQVEKYKAETRQSKSVEVDFDETPTDMYGITEREYGEMKAYNPPLGNVELASRVKSLKAKGHTLAEIATMLGQAEMTVRHYSSALFKASPTKKRG